MNLSFNNFYLNDNIISKIEHWIQSYKLSSSSKILIIYGNHGIGKKSLAKLILKDYTICY